MEKVRLILKQMQEIVWLRTNHNRQHHFNTIDKPTIQTDGLTRPFVWMVSEQGAQAYYLDSQPQKSSLSFSILSLRKTAVQQFYYYFNGDTFQEIPAQTALNIAWDLKDKISITIHYEDGDYTETWINKTFEEAKQYYVGRACNVGLGPEDNLKKCTHLTLGVVMIKDYEQLIKTD